QPMPTFCVKPNRLPLGSSRSMSGVRGSRPAGPAPASRPAATALAEPSTASSGGASSLRYMFTTLPQRQQEREHDGRHHGCDADEGEPGSPRLEGLHLPPPPDCPTKARSITGPIPVACSATPNAPLAAMIRIITPALIRDMSTISARLARLTPRCRAYTHIATAAATSSARLGFPMIAV